MDAGCLHCQETGTHAEFILTGWGCVSPFSSCGPRRCVADLVGSPLNPLWPPWTHLAGLNLSPSHCLVILPGSSARLPAEWLLHLPLLSCAAAAEDHQKSQVWRLRGLGGCPEGSPLPPCAPKEYKRGDSSAQSVACCGRLPTYFWPSFLGSRGLGFEAC